MVMLHTCRFCSGLEVVHQESSNCYAHAAASHVLCALHSKNPDFFSDWDAKYVSLANAITKSERRQDVYYGCKKGLELLGLQGEVHQPTDHELVQTKLRKGICYAACLYLQPRYMEKFQTNQPYEFKEDAMVYTTDQEMSPVIARYGFRAHAVGIIGGESDRFIIRNSWGASWGNKGFKAAARNQFQMLYFCKVSITNVPSPDKAPVANGKFYIGNTSTKDPTRDGWYHWRLFISPSGAPDDCDCSAFAKSIVVELDPTFRPSAFSLSPDEAAFKRTGWDTFTVKISIHFRSGQKKTFPHELAWNGKSHIQKLKIPKS